MSQVNKIVIAIILGSIIIGGFMYWGIQSASEVVKNNDLTVGLQDSAVKLQEVKNSLVLKELSLSSILTEYGNDKHTKKRI